MKTRFKILLGILCVPVMGIAGLIAVATLYDFCPGPVEPVFENPEANAIFEHQTYNLMIWNIGYGGLGRDMDFFYDGGRQVRPDRDIVEENILAIETVLSGQTFVDFFLLQEVDQHSKRSYYIDEASTLSALLPRFHSSFGKNYDVFFVPLPLHDPLGPVRSGLQTLARFEPLKVDRHAFPGNYAWPKGLFLLDRCFLVSRYRVENGKQLLVINTHNSAYDDGSLRSNQMAYLRHFLLEEYGKGNYVIVGGDWNQCPPGFVPGFKYNRMDNTNRMEISQDFLPEWTWAHDPSLPTNRRLNVPYERGKSLTTVIDFFLVSPNIDVMQVRGIPLDFEHSDHQPVTVKIKFKE